MLNFLQELKESNRNVKLVFSFSFLQSLGRGVWFGAVFSAFIYFIAGESNQILGWTSAATGVAMTLVLLPSGIIADKFRRDWLLKTAAITGSIALITIALANSLLPIFIALVFWGLTQGLVRPSLESIFADSVPSGSRSGIYSKLHLVRNFAMSVGPFLNVGLFYYLGDVWEITVLKSVIYVGLVISGSSIITLFMMSDDEAMDEASEAFEEIEDKSDETVVPKISNRRRFIPIILVTSNLLIGSGAGMTIKFFPIFFLDIYDLFPIAVNLILGFTTIFTGLTAIAVQKWSLSRGRTIMIASVQFLSILCLVAIAFVPPIILLVPLFIARGSLMNASQPLSRSILMDYVPKSSRGKWNSIEALAWGMFWNVSALLGGYLIDFWGYSTTFLITAGIYVVGTIPILFLIPLVANETPIDELSEDKLKEFSGDVLYPEETPEETDGKLKITEKEYEISKIRE